MSYSQAGQDEFVLGLIGILEANGMDKKSHYFVDIGCWDPAQLNNTLLLEEAEWNGLSIDITDMKNEWRSRRNPFICGDALLIDYKALFNTFKSPDIIEYLNVDIEGDGLRFEALKKVFASEREFKIITIEHDSYRGYNESERLPQRAFLTERGYTLLCGDVCLTGNAFEDWWVNPKFFNNEIINQLLCSNVEYTEILKKL